MENFEGFQNNEKTREERKKYEEEIKREKEFSNPGTFPFHFIDALRRARANLTPEEIIMGDAERINELKDKKEKRKLTEEEKEELKFRENSELFIDVFEERDIQTLRGLIGVHSPKEAFYPVYIIKGIVDGKEVYLQKHVYPKFTTDQLAKESANSNPFYMRDWEGPVVNEYKGQVESKEISEEEAEKLFSSFEPFAKKRSQEIRDLKKEKEKEKYGHEVGSEHYEYRVEKEPGSFSN